MAYWEATNYTRDPFSQLGVLSIASAHPGFCNDRRLITPTSPSRCSPRPRRRSLPPGDGNHGSLAKAEFGPGPAASELEKGHRREARSFQSLPTNPAKAHLFADVSEIGGRLGMVA